jgi:hypothetical protein
VKIAGKNIAQTTKKISVTIEMMHSSVGKEQLSGSVDIYLEIHRPLNIPILDLHKSTLIPIENKYPK